MFVDHTRIIESATFQAVADEIQESAVSGSSAPHGSPPVMESWVRIQNLAYLLWQERGRPIGSPDEDWFAAVRTLNPRESEARLPLFALGIERSTS
jgi:hypothetical protein